VDAAVSPYLRIAGVLVFLGALATMVGGGGLLAYAATSRQWAFVRRVAAAMGIVLWLYLGSFAVFAWLGAGRSLAMSEEKFFCAVDCDLAFSVLALAKQPVAADGTRVWQVTIRARSAAARATQRPAGARVFVRDVDGRTYAADPAATRSFDPGVDPADPFAFDLGPGEARVVHLAFRLPASIPWPELVVTEGGWPGRLVPGDENAPLHRPIGIRLH
jgi:hypothetical protein